jgi:serine/threonine protein phosphatase PrpC
LVSEGDQFCEHCGASLGSTQAAESRCPACGAEASAIGRDGYCTACGERVPRDDDRVERDLTFAAAVSDRGLVHRRNEDSFFLEAIGENAVAAVVCDGISSASASNAAARDAAQTAGQVLSEAVADPEREVADAMIEAIDAARVAVEQVPWTSRTRRADPSCTLVSAVYRDGEIVVGWVGDSRAYWLDADGARQVTVDDSFAEEAVAEGVLTPEQAARSPFLHSITHWVGPDAPDRPPRVTVHRPDRAGRLVLCTDGLWNYAPTPSELVELVGTVPPGAPPVDVARALVGVAIDRGGRDNITVAIVDIDDPNAGERSAPGSRVDLEGPGD